VHAGWWYKPDFIINDININSAVTSPAHDEVITLAEGNSHVSIAGYAWLRLFRCTSSPFCVYAACMQFIALTGLERDASREAWHRIEMT